jgi:hypothetical protein
VKQGYGVASGKARDNPYPEGTIKMQLPYFQVLGLDLSELFPGTLNVSISPYRFQVKQASYYFPQVKWYASISEDFSFSPISLSFNEQNYSGWLYYPHPETKPAHFQDYSTMELILPLIEGISYDDEVIVEVKTTEILLT